MLSQQTDLLSGHAYEAKSASAQAFNLCGKLLASLGAICGLGLILTLGLYPGEYGFSSDSGFGFACAGAILLSSSLVGFALVNLLSEAANDIHAIRKALVKD